MIKKFNDDLGFLHRRKFLSIIDQEEQRKLKTLEALHDVQENKLIDSKLVHAWLENWGTHKKIK